MPHNSKKGVFAGVIGNVLEWYDFAVYGYFATIIAGNFFPEEDKVAGLIATFGIFAAGFIVRPLGGVIFGNIGDKYGRKKALTLSVFLMAIPTTTIGILPTYQSIGFYAPLLLVLLRLLQGISVGGEFTGSISYVVENAPKGKRGFYGSTTILGAVGGILLGSLVGTILSSIIQPDDLKNWGWRIPFFAGIFIGFAGYLLRRHMDEGENFKKLKASGSISKSPVKDFFRDHKKTAILSILGIWTFSVSFYMIFLYLASYTHTFLDYSLSDALQINTIGMAFLMIMIPLMGILTDKIGRKKVLISGLVGMIIFTIPLFILVDQAEYWHILAAQISFAVLVGSQQAVVPSMLVERFPTKIRYTGLSVSYNMALALFGGTTPMISTWLIHEFGENLLMPGYYLLAVSLISLIAVSQFKETYKSELI